MEPDVKVKTVNALEAAEKMAEAKLQRSSARPALVGQDIASNLQIIPFPGKFHPDKQVSHPLFGLSRP